MLLNIFLIGALLLVRPVSGAGAGLGGDGGGLRAIPLADGVVPARRAAAALPRPRLTPEVRRLLRLMLPGVFGAGVTQLNLVISTAIASLLPTGAVSYLYYADRLEPAAARRRRHRGRHRDPAAAVAPGAPRRRPGAREHRKIAGSSWRCC